jgi:hypothetical protein
MCKCQLGLDPKTCNFAFFCAAHKSSGQFLLKRVAIEIPYNRGCLVCSDSSSFVSSGSAHLSNFEENL